MRLHSKTILIFIFLLSANLFVFGQNIRKQEKPPISERLFFGGSFGLSFGDITYIDISPTVGLWVLPRVAIAVGPSYLYYKYKGRFSTTELSMYGGRFYTQFLLVENIPILNTGILLHLEDELSHYKINSPPKIAGNYNANRVLLGGGIRQQIGGRSFLNLTALWTIHYSGYSIHSSPEIRVSFSF